MRKKTFKHECKSPLGNNGTKRRINKSAGKKSKKIETESLKNIYNKYYQNQVAALYNAVKGC